MHPLSQLQMHLQVCSLEGWLNLSTFSVSFAHFAAILLV